MTNDTTNLSGALRELGETMARNLSTMGVTSTYDEGLSTLASKILTIHLETSLSSDTDVLSYADSSSAVLTAKVLEAGSALTGETVKFYKYVDGTNDVLLGSDVTDNNGEASYTYASAGIGDFEVYAKVRGLESESCSIEDCIYYNETEVTRTSTNGSTIYDNNLAVDLPSKCEISYDISSTNVSADSERRWFLLPKSQFSTSTTQPAYGLFFQIASSTGTFSGRENNVNLTGVNTGSISADTVYTIKYVRDGTTLQEYFNNVLINTRTITFLDNYTDWTLSMIRWSATGTTKLKNVKIKPL